MARTAATSSSPATVLCLASASRPISATPGRAATAGSTSRGIARSRNTRASRRLAGTMSAVITWSAAPVQQITMSAPVMAAGRPSSPVTRVAARPDLAASLSACRRVRLATTRLLAPSRQAVVAARALIEPAPTTSTSRPARLGTPGAVPSGAEAGRLGEAASIARLSRLTPVRPIPVSARARLPVRSASRPRSPRTRPTAPCSAASLIAERTWPTICSSPTTIESSPQATASRWPTARSS